MAKMTTKFITTFIVFISITNIYEEYERLRKSGIIFIMEPTEMGDTVLTVFDDTCGNLIQIYQI